LHGSFVFPGQLQQDITPRSTRQDQTPRQYQEEADISKVYRKKFNRTWKMTQTTSKRELMAKSVRGMKGGVDQKQSVSTTNKVVGGRVWCWRLAFAKK
jgi:hypothetical protein